MRGECIHLERWMAWKLWGLGTRRATRHTPLLYQHWTTFDDNTPNKINTFFVYVVKSYTLDYSDSENFLPLFYIKRHLLFHMKGVSGYLNESYIMTFLLRENVTSHQSMLGTNKHTLNQILNFSVVKVKQTKHWILKTTTLTLFNPLYSLTSDITWFPNPEWSQTASARWTNVTFSFFFFSSITDILKCEFRTWIRSAPRWRLYPCVFHRQRERESWHFFLARKRPYSAGVIKGKK